MMGLLSASTIASFHDHLGMNIKLIKRPCWTTGSWFIADNPIAFKASVSRSFSEVASPVKRLQKKIPRIALSSNLTDTFNLFTQCVSSYWSISIKSPFIGVWGICLNNRTTNAPFSLGLFIIRQKFDWIDRSEVAGISWLHINTQWAKKNLVLLVSNWRLEVMAKCQVS